MEQCVETTRDEQYINSPQTTPRKEGNKNSNTDENDIDEVTTRSNVEMNLEGMTKQAVALKQWYNTDKRTLL